MARLEELTRGASIKGILADGLVTMEINYWDHRPEELRV
jgi:hypothetical protein